MAAPEITLSDLLGEKAVILVHFSSPPGGRDVGRCYPFDLQNAIATKPDLCCSSISAVDTEQNAFGFVGIVVVPEGLRSIKGVAPNDDGSLDANGVREYEDPDVTPDKCRVAIDERGTHGMNEWGVAAGCYVVAGIFIFEFFLFGRENSAERLASLRKDFPGQRIFSQCDGSFVEVGEDDTTKMVTIPGMCGS